MRNLTRSIITIFLIILLTFLIYVLIMLHVKSININKMYSGEVYGRLFSTSPNQYEELMKSIDEINGVDVSNVSYVNYYEDLDVLYVDQVYYDKFLQNLQVIEGRNFNSKDFTFVFDDTKPVPVIVTEDYSRKNNIQVGDETNMKILTPTTCELFGNSGVGFGVTGNAHIETMNETEEQCVHSDPYNLQEEEFTNIPVEIIGIIPSVEEIPTFEEEGVSNDKLVIFPNFIIKDANMGLYDLDSYYSNEPIYTNYATGETIFVNYEKITFEEFDFEMNQIRNRYGDVHYYLNADMEKSNFEDQEKIYIQIIIFWIYLLLILILFWYFNTAYKLKYLEYKFSVFHLLGVKSGQMARRIFKGSIVISMLEMGVLFLFFIMLEKFSNLKINLGLLLIICILLFVLLKTMEYLLIMIKYKQILKSDLNKIYSGGEL